MPIRWAFLVAVLYSAAYSNGQTPKPQPTQQIAAAATADISGFGAPQSLGTASPSLDVDGIPAQLPSSTVISPNGFDGSLTLTFDIALPTSKGKNAPPLSLTYNSTLSDGPLGIGWSIPVTLVSRNVRKGLNYGDNAFVFKLSGNSTELTGSPDGSTFLETIPRNRVMCRSIKGSDGEAAWEAFDISGNHYLLGMSNATRERVPNGPIFSWLLESVTDRNGNTATYTYQTDNGQLLLSTISYWGNSSLGLPAPMNIRFVYSPRPDQRVDYSARFLRRSTLRLTEIEVRVGTAPLKTYELAYSQSPTTTRSLLTSITETHGKVSFPPTTFQYSGRTVDTRAFVPASFVASTGRASQSCLAGDFIGNGQTAEACYQDSLHQWTILQRASTGDFLESPWPNGPTPNGPATTRCFAADLNGDGKSDLACYADGPNWTVSLSTGTGWTTSTWPGQATALPLSTQCLIGDFNGDGRADIACNAGTPGQWKISLSTGSSWNTSIWNTAVGPTSGTVANSCFAGNFSGGGYSDIACSLSPTGATSPSWKLALSTGSGFTDATWLNGASTTTPARDACLTGDFNGDGLLDIACLQDTSGNWAVALSTGNGWDSHIWASGPIPALPHSPASIHNVGRACLVSDFNGDGRTDLACWNWQSPAPRATVAPVVSQGDQWAPLGSDLTPRSSSATDDCSAPHLTGSTKASFMCGISSSDGSLTFNYKSVNDEPVDILTDITSSKGSQSHFVYALASSSEASAIPASMNLLSEWHTTSGHGSDRDAITRYAYEGGLFDVTEHEFRGFNHVTTTYPANYLGKALRQNVWFHQGDDLAPINNHSTAIPPLSIGLPYKITLLDAHGHNLLSRTYTYTSGTSTYPFVSPKHIEVAIATSTTPATQTTDLSYDVFGNTTTITETASNTVVSRRTDLTYPPLLAPWIISLPLSYEVDDQSGARLSRIDYKYDGVGCDGSSDPGKAWNLVSTTQWIAAGISATELFSHDHVGRATCYRDSNGGKWIYGYDPDKDRLLSIANPLSQTTTYTYLGVGTEPLATGPPGALHSIADVNGNKHVIAYDSLGRESEHVEPDGTWTHWDYGKDGNPNAQYLKISTASGNEQTSFFDGLNRIYKIQTKLGSEGISENDYSFDATGQMTFVEGPFSPTESAGPIIGFKYDELGRTISVIDAGANSETDFCYDGLSTGSMDAEGRLTRVTKDALGRPLRAVTYMGRVDTCTAAGDPTISSGEAARLLLVMPFGDLNALPKHLPILQERLLSYDALDRLASVVSGETVLSKLSYDGRSLLSHYVDVTGRSYELSHDANGSITELHDLRSGRFVSFKRDGLERVTQVSAGHSLVTDSISNYVFDRGTNGIGKLSSSQSGDTRDDYAYDNMGRLVSADRVIGKQRFRLEFTFDGEGRATGITYPNSHSVEYSYDANVISSVLVDGQSLATFASLNGYAQPRTITLSNGEHVSLDYYTGYNPKCLLGPRKAMCSQSIFRAGSDKPERSIRYKYDGSGNVKEIIDDETDVKYEFDALDRVIATGTDSFDEERGLARALGWKGQFTFGEPATNASYSYSDISDRTQVSSQGAYLYGSTNKAAPTSVGKKSTVLDDDGRIIRYDGDSYRFNSLNELSRVSHVTNRSWLAKAVGMASTSSVISYDAGGLPSEYRIERVLPFGIGRIIPRRKILKESPYYGCRNNACVMSIYGPTGILAQVGSKEWQALHANNLGTVIETVNRSGNSIRRIHVDLFGLSAAKDKPILYAGHDWLDELGLYQIGVRFYHPSLGMFLSPDASLHPALMGGNPYSYARNNPGRFVDSTGREDEEGGDRGGDSSGGGGGEAEKGTESHDASGDHDPDMHETVDTRDPTEAFKDAVGQNQQNQNHDTAQGWRDPSVTDRTEKDTEEPGKDSDQSGGVAAAASDRAQRDIGHSGGPSAFSNHNTTPSSASTQSHKAEEARETAENVFDGLVGLLADKISPPFKYKGIFFKYLDPALGFFDPTQATEANPAKYEFDPPMPNPGLPPLVYPTTLPGPSLEEPLLKP